MVNLLDAKSSFFTLSQIRFSVMEMNYKYSVEIAKKEIEKAIIDELFKKNIIDICQSNNIIKKIDEDIFKYKNKIRNIEGEEKLVVKIPL